MGYRGIFLCIVLLSAGVFFSGCTDSPLTDGTAPAQSINEYDLIRQGITAAEKECTGDVPRGAPTDVCIITSPDRETIVDTIIMKLKEEEGNCLEDLPRRMEARLCTVKDTDKIQVGKQAARIYTTHHMYAMTESIEESVERAVSSSLSLPYPA